ncbi:hypothetical protein [uncultured Corynebacterium sp.]|uniref:hypothetical protein n=1 Tax=uncultured Corynebacterium sp. TaxID=159447 RepID=UPI0028EC49CB|nr:hypothetical protein [uncultured Corynebacterium sp.]
MPSKMVGGISRMIFGNGLVDRHALSGAGSDQVSRRSSGRAPEGSSPPEPRKDCDGRHGHYQMNDS